MSAETLSSMHIKTLSLTPKGRGGSLELQTDGDVQRNDLKHLDGRELQVFHLMNLTHAVMSIFLSLLLLLLLFLLSM